MDIIIYCIFKENTPLYIGKTKNSLNLRQKQHQKKFNFNINLIELDKVGEKDWKFWECYWINQFKQWGFILLNKNKGGGGPEYHTEESKLKMSLTPKYFNSIKLKGIKRPDVSYRFKGKSLSDDTKLKISESKRNHPSYNDPERGNKIKTSNYIHYKEGSERNRKISNKLKGRKAEWTSARNINILQYNKDMNFIKEWKSATEASKYINKKPSAISECCSGKRKTAYGFIWKYK